ncbi:MAG TPA: NAD(P)/FAD-dependent oxidoreductase [Streptosporangiaceae bacterium]|nr:NAD(P)/FAD-dependent oxidoreductase [Streptosporangiaceae bacterium]
MIFGSGQRHIRADIVIVGAGFAGIGMAIALDRAGRHDYVILEKAAEIGGTWRENTYPGCACDIRSLLYSFSFEPKRDWSRQFPMQPEILEYLRHCVDRYGLADRIEFGAEATSMAYDEAAGRWTVRLADGRSLDCRALVTAMGPLHQPNIPAIPGDESFAGPRFHSAQWDHGVDLAGKRVSVIGTGASAIQIVPQVAKVAGHVTVFQRTPPWVLPKPDRPITGRLHRLFRTVPGFQRAYRWLIYWEAEATIVTFTRPRLAGLGERMGRAFIARQIPDPALRAKVTPNYRMGCKRVLLANDYYPALTRANVDLVTEGVTGITPDGVVAADGGKYPADVIVYSTGFHVTDAFAHADITGAGGRRIADVWRDGPEAYLGATVAGFPNLFVLLGPNTGLGHNSMIFMIESEVHYVTRCLDLIDARGPLAVSGQAQLRYNADLQRRLAGSVWNAGGCASWYLDANGVNRAIWPGSTVRYWWLTRRLRARDYAPVPAGAAGAGAAESAIARPATREVAR